MSQIIGKVGMTPRGMYDRTRAYERLDVVTYQGSSWVAIVDVPAQISPAMGSDYWQLQARMGETGPQGPVGPQGNSAFDGTGVELVNNLTQGGQTAALSAEQGKILKQELTELESKLGTYTENEEYIRAYIDSEGKFLWGIKSDGTIYIPNREMYHIDSNSEFAKVVLDSDGKVLFGIKKDGSCFIPKGISEEAKKGLIDLTTRISFFENYFCNTDSAEFAKVVLDSDGKILEGITSTGKKFLPKQEMLDKYEDIEGRMEMTLDANGKIVSYRDSDGVLHETKMSIETSLALGVGAMSDLQKALKKDGFNADSPIDWSNDSTITLPIPRSCAKVNIISQTGLAVSKTEDKKCVLEYWDKSGNYFKKFIVLNAQGSSSMSYIEKNQGIDIYNDETYEESCDITFGDWVAQDSFHLKCYYIDVFRGICNVGYKLCEEVIRHMDSRNNRVLFNTVDITDSNSTGDFDTDFGDKALCHPDGFPFEMYVNGEYYGLFAWNIKKHRKNYSMDKKDYSQALLDGVIDSATFFNGTIDWTQFELRNPKELVTMDGKEYDADTNRNELIDATSSVYDSSNKVHVNTSKIKELIIRQSNAMSLIKAANDEDAKVLFESYYDKLAMIAYYIVANVIFHEDGFRKNWIWTLYDKIFAPSFYDLDSIFGRHWTGSYIVSYSTTSILGESTSLPTGQLMRLYKDEVKEWYKELRDSEILSVSNIMQILHGWIEMSGIDAIKRNVEKWNNTPSYRKERTENDGTSVEGGMFDSPQRVERWLTERLEHFDSHMDYVRA